MSPAACNARSPTAEHVFSSWREVETDSAGLGADADVPLSPEQLAWVCLDIPDDYGYLQPELVRLLEAKAGPFLR